MPTEVEHRHLIRQSRFSFDAQRELCGFGPVSAAASTATLIARHQPERVLLTGIAGTFDPDALPVGTAAVFSKVVMYGVGIGAGDVFRSASGAELRIGDELSLMSPVRPVAGALLTCGTASTSKREALERRARAPDVSAEDMEGFAVALACRLADVPIAIVRGISNEVGDRDHDRWQIAAALDAAWLVVTELVGRTSWESGP